MADLVIRAAEGILATILAGAIIVLAQLVSYHAEQTARRDVRALQRSVNALEKTVKETATEARHLAIDTTNEENRNEEFRP